MICDQCGAAMVNVGREIKPGHPNVWMDGWVCSVRKCPAYAATYHDGSVTRWPAMTLMDGVLHSNIQGALKFRDRA